MRVAGAVLLVVAGAATVASAVALHQLWWGFLLGTAATTAALLGVRRGWLTRLPFALGWVIVVVWVAPRRPEGDYLISSDALGYALLGFGLLVLVFAVVTLPHPRRVGAGDDGRAS